MTNQECSDRLHQLIYTCGVNTRYHQTTEWWWGRADQASRIAIAVTAMFSLAIVLSNSEYWLMEISFAVASVVIAVVLNVIPLGEREKFYSEMFHQWTDLRSDSEVLESKVSPAKPQNKCAAHNQERLRELLAKLNSLESREPAPWKWILRRCQHEENERRYGLGIRTYEDVKKYLRQKSGSNAVS